MTAWPFVLVTGAEEHQGLAVIRGLGCAGIPVIACGSHRRSLGFYSRYATRCATYASPFRDRDRFVADMLEIIDANRPALVVPVAESTLVVLSSVRDQFPPGTALAAPPPSVLDCAIDKLRTVRLAEAVGVPVPKTAWGSDAAEVLDRARSLTFPVAIKPRGNALNAGTAHSAGFKVRYAKDFDELARLLASQGAGAAALLVQEYVTGIGRCVSAVCRDGVPLVQFAYEREREYPLSGGVSVVRASIPLEPRVAEWTARLLGSMDWQGVAMVEFKYDRATDKYVLMEVNGRFQASTALSLDAGLNLPLIAASVFLNRPVDVPAQYHIGVRERWLRGDLMALRDGLALARGKSPTRRPNGGFLPRHEVLRQFLRDFAGGTRYDEFKLDDWRPALIEALAVGRIAGEWVLDVLKGPARVARRAWPRLRGAQEMPVST